jgi:hypothetical protein
MRRLVLGLALAVGLLAGCPPPSAPPKQGNGVATATSALWAGAAADYEHAIDAALELAPRDRSAAVKAIDDAYFTIYEGQARNIEVATRLNVGAKQMREREDAKDRLKQAVRMGAPEATIRKIRSELVDGVAADAAKLDEMKVEPPK